jgi:hypothetical protein
MIKYPNRGCPMFYQIKDKTHPFLVWYAYMVKRRYCLTTGSDIILNEAGAIRFRVAYEDDDGEQKPVLGINIFDKDALTSIRWNAAAMVSGRQFKDWVALACTDIRVGDSAAQSVIPMRLWIPIPLGSFDRFKRDRNCSLLMKRYKNAKDDFPKFEKAAFATLQMQFKNEWPT